MREFSDEQKGIILRSYAKKRHAEDSLYEFLKQSWSQIEGITPFIGGWHIEAIAEHLQAAFNRDIKNLLIHVPPRSSKTSLISVVFPAWVWLHNPQEKFMYASYATSLALEHSLKCRRLIESSWYQRRWGSKFQLASDQNAKGFFENTAMGYRISTSVGASATGRGASILVCFPSHVLIQTDKGPIEIGRIVEEKIDCKVLSYNHSLELLEYKEIEEFEKNKGKEIIEIEFEDGTILECTEDHPVWIEDKGYISAKDIQEDDIVLTIL